MNTHITSNPKLFNDLAGLEWKHYYDSYAKIGEIKFLIHKVGYSYLCLPFTTINSDIICSGRSFVGGFMVRKIKPDDFSKYVTNCFNHLYDAGFKNVIHKELPQFYKNQIGLSKWQLKVTLKSSIDAGETSIVYRNEIMLSADSKRLYSKYHNNFEIRHLHDENEIKASWNFLSDSLSDRNLGILPLDRVLFLTSKLGQRFKLFGISNRNKERIGTVLVDSYFGVSRFVNYFFLKNNEARGAFQTFFTTYVESKVNEFKIIDLGSSSDPNTGDIVDSILKFKQNFNTRQVQTFQRRYFLTSL